MRIWILIFSAALFAGGTCLGVALQPRLAPPTPPVKIAPPAPTPPGDRHHFSVHRFISELGLSGDQERDLDIILSETQEEMKALGRAMRATQEKSRERIEGILSPEQKSQLDSLMAAERKKRSEDDLNRSTAAYKKILGLTDEESISFRAVLAEARSRRREFKGGDWHQARKESRDQQNKALEKALPQDKYKRYLEVSELERFDR